MRAFRKGLRESARGRIRTFTVSRRPLRPLRLPVFRHPSAGPDSNRYSFGKFPTRAGGLREPRSTALHWCRAAGGRERAPSSYPLGLKPRAAPQRNARRPFVARPNDGSVPMGRADCFVRVFSGLRRAIETISRFQTEKCPGRGPRPGEAESGGGGGSGRVLGLALPPLSRRCNPRALARSRLASVCRPRALRGRDAQACAVHSPRVPLRPSGPQALRAHRALALRGP
jgi:hypothetical protein